MAKLVWDKAGEHYYETGVDHGVLYSRNMSGVYDNGYAWNGLTSVTESPSGAESSPQYADNGKYLNLISEEEFGATIEAFTYPDEFAQYNGEAELADGVYAGQQKRGTFGLSYRTKVGDDVNGQDKNYKLHLIYGCTAAPSEKAYSTVNDSPEATTFSWEISTTPVDVPGFKPTASITLDSRKVEEAKLKAIEKVLYGSDESPETKPRLPLPAEIIQIISGH